MRGIGPLVLGATAANLRSATKERGWSSVRGGEGQQQQPFTASSLTFHCLVLTLSSSLTLHHLIPSLESPHSKPRITSSQTPHHLIPTPHPLHHRCHPCHPPTCTWVAGGQGTLPQAQWAPWAVLLRLAVQPLLPPPPCQPLSGLAQRSC